MLPASRSASSWWKSGKRAMRIFPDMKCCKPGRQFVGLTCDAGTMALCMAEHCARLRTADEQRSFAAQVARVSRIDQGSMLQAFRDQVARLVARRNTKGTK